LPPEIADSGVYGVDIVVWCFSRKEDDFLEWDMWAVGFVVLYNYVTKTAE
jgi:hypothetical protein